jgi:hypothetical protein
MSCKMVEPRCRVTTRTSDFRAFLISDSSSLDTPYRTFNVTIQEILILILLMTILTFIHLHTFIRNVVLINRFSPKLGKISPILGKISRQILLVPIKSLFSRKHTKVVCVDEIDRSSWKYEIFNSSGSGNFFGYS